MKTDLMPTQIADVDNITSGVDVPNFSEPGTGKTLTAIGCIDKLKLQSGLVVCPTIATSMWVENLEYELGARVQWLNSRAVTIDKKVDFLVASYGVLEAHSADLFARDNNALIIDESHYCKSSTAQRTQLLFGERCDGAGGLYETSAQCWELTGTPIERYADDLWSQLRATQPEVLQKFQALSLEAFQRQFCKMGDYGGTVSPPVAVDTQNEKLLNEMIYKDIGAIRRMMSEVDPYMPEATFRTIYVKSEVNEELRELMKGKTVEEIEQLLIESDGSVVRARQLLSMSKLDGIFDYVESIAKDKQVLVGYWHTEVGSKIYTYLLSRGYVAKIIGGHTKPEDRDLIKKRFIAGDIQVVVGQIQAMGQSLDGLQHACDHVIFAEQDWSAAKTEQFYKRVKRKGQKNHVQVDFCISNHLIDIALKNVRERKAASAEQILMVGK